LWVAVLALSAGALHAADSPAPLGTLVDVGGYSVHLYCTGAGSPAVVVAGGGFSFDWGLVQPKISTLTRICTYDLSGTAWSDPRRAKCQRAPIGLPNCMNSCIAPQSLVLSSSSGFRSAASMDASTPPAIPKTSQEW